MNDFKKLVDAQLSDVLGQLKAKGHYATYMPFNSTGNNRAVLDAVPRPEEPPRNMFGPTDYRNVVYMTVSKLNRGDIEIEFGSFGAIHYRETVYYHRFTVDKLGELITRYLETLITSGV